MSMYERRNNGNEQEIEIMAEDSQQRQIHLIVEDDSSCCYNDGLEEDVPTAVVTFALADSAVSPVSSSLPSSPSSLSSSSCCDYVRYSNAAALFAEAACQSICVVSGVLKNEADCVKKRVQNVQDRIQEANRANKKRRIESTATATETSTTTTPTCNGDEGHNTNNNTDDDDTRCVIPITEQVSIREQSFRMKRLSILLRKMDAIHIQLLDEMKQCAVNAAILAAAEGDTIC
jgi:hypothetical protein